MVSVRPDDALDGDGCAERLAVGLARAGEVERGLVAEAEEKVLGCGIGCVAGHGDGAVEVAEAGVAGAFEGDGWKSLRLLFRIGLGLEDGDFHRVGGLVFRGDGAEESSAVVETLVDVAEEVFHGARRSQ